jgi:hypothetical protein
MVWRIRVRLLASAHPKLASNTILTVAACLGSILSYHYLTLPHTLPGQETFTSNTIKQLTNPLALSLAHNTALPGGPSGQLLPPGALAPDRSYANSYAWGQCTWYVAGRRPIPAGWGNAAAWYYHAIANGWRVGTVPAVGAIAWTSAGAYGHVSLVENISPNNARIYVSEMNVRGVGVKSYAWIKASSVKYIY